MATVSTCALLAILSWTLEKPRKPKPPAKARMDTAAIAAAIAARNDARKAKNFAESDRIRDELLANGIVLKDGPQGTTWEVQK